MKKPLETTNLDSTARDALEDVMEFGHISKFTPLTDNGDARQHHLTEPEFHALDTEYTLPLAGFVADNPKFWGGPEFNRKAGELRAGAVLQLDAQSQQGANARMGKYAIENMP
jgi:hypothetical protein